MPMPLYQHMSLNSLFFQKGLRTVKTPKKTVRDYCIACADGAKNVRQCGGNKNIDGSKCPFYDYRIPGAGGKISVKIIRKFCYECMGNCSEASRLIFQCKSESTCSLFPYRLGKNPMAQERWDNLSDEVKVAKLKILQTKVNVSIGKKRQ